jgi:hypothetical protein
MALGMNSPGPVAGSIADYFRDMPHCSGELIEHLIFIGYWDLDGIAVRNVRDLYVVISH